MTEQTSVFSLDDRSMEQIERKFREKQHIAQARIGGLFEIFREELTAEETWALKFLYAYMPLNDLADYDGPLFLSHVRRTLDIRKRVPWGKRVPDHLFLHFVLPYRVNSENIEDCRGILYDELAARTANLSMAEAILETNYWCHEKAVYIGSDLRTISPLTMMRTARGRCGEESTLAVAALRSLGIPARQCYTPRWAHCDDNHAWVEAWADGQWYFIGACEPEPRLNLGWFSPPARRAMLINTRVPANYPGPEDITLAHEWYTEINLLDGYAPARTITVVVKDGNGRPVDGAHVQFQLYNMAELTPIAALPTNERGEASFKTGFGDLVIRAVHAGGWGEEKITVADGERFEIVLNRTKQEEGTADFDMVPPPERGDDASDPVSGKEMERHNGRIEEGTKIRKSFEETFADEAQATDLARILGLQPERVWDVLRKARGNSREMAAFLQERSHEYGEWPLRLLESLNEKDLADTFRETLDDHLIASLSQRRDYPEDTFVRYILCPRVQYEMIGPYKRFFQGEFTDAESALFRANPPALVSRLDKEWEIREDLSHLQGKATPLGTFRLKKGDRTSFAIMFVAICRSIGIPARLHPSERKPQYMADSGWKDAVFENGSGRQPERKDSGKLLLLRDTETAAEAPAASYSENVTIARLENGNYKTLIYPHGKSDMYDEPFEVEQGSYRMTSGIRLKDGTALVRFTYFTVSAGELTQVPLTFRQAPLHLPVLGSVDRRSTFTLPDGGDKTLGELAGTNGAIIAWIEPEREPSKHLIREIRELAEALTASGAPVILAVGDDKSTATFDLSSYPGLPADTIIVRDSGFASLRSFMSDFPGNEAGFPHVFVLDGQDQIRYKESGYKLGTGKEALQVFCGVWQQQTDRSEAK
ncbi:transglutaminase domain-containing protein [Paenibacillus alkaliterrae]|uniref:transglutaminase domain-containing protein n=1 Tax=Paenibacillus alkaliterrae TaxID=320909 RepID=UPI001F280B62|nr:transglutaminase domain-containing protein [Paenibacillus alkaliterrae]MCF2938098.1 transglutaminase domain-containing protein [Paenibacillus alkaliterrae]